MPESPASYRVFLSSTSEDLVEYRKRVKEVVERLNLGTVRMEAFVAVPQTPVDECMKRVDGCDALVVIVAHRYGWVPSPEEGGDGVKSITYLEVARALEGPVRKPVFAFLVDENVPWSGPKEQDRLVRVGRDEAVGVWDAVEGLRALKAFLSQRVVHDSFVSPDDLAARATASLTRWLLGEIPKQVGADAETLQLLNAFLDEDPPNAPSPEVLGDAIRNCTSSCRQKVLERAERIRMENWQRNKARMARTIPVFRALVEADGEGRDHRARGNLGFALKDLIDPSWEEAKEMLDQAIRLRNERPGEEMPFYEFNRALCRIHLDEEFRASERSTPYVRAQILKDLRDASGLDIGRMLAGYPAVQDWMRLNGVTDRDLG